MFEQVHCHTSVKYMYTAQRTRTFIASSAHLLLLLLLHLLDASHLLGLSLDNHGLGLVD